MAGYGAGFHAPHLTSGWNGRQGCEGGRENTGEAVGTDVEEGILGDGGIHLSADVPGSSQVKRTAAQRKAGYSGDNGKKAGLGVRGISQIGRRMEDVGGRWSGTREPYR